MSAYGFNYITWRQEVPDGHPAFLDGANTSCYNNEDTTSLQCDEYPYLASEQGGPDLSKNPDPEDSWTWTGFTLDLIDADLNGLEGDEYNFFKRDKDCGLVDAEGKMIRGKPFLVLPMPDGLPTHWYCPPSSS